MYRALVYFTPVFLKTPFVVRLCDDKTLRTFCIFFHFFLNEQIFLHKRKMVGTWLRWIICSNLQHGETRIIVIICDTITNCITARYNYITNIIWLELAGIAFTLLLYAIRRFTLTRLLLIFQKLQIEFLFWRFRWSVHVQCISFSQSAIIIFFFFFL